MNHRQRLIWWRAWCACSSGPVSAFPTWSTRARTPTTTAPTAQPTSEPTEARRGLSMTHACEIQLWNFNKIFFLSIIVRYRNPQKVDGSTDWKDIRSSEFIISFGRSSICRVGVNCCPKKENKMSMPPPYSNQQQVIVQQGTSFWLITKAAITLTLFPLVPVTQTVIVQSAKVGPAPTLTQCPNCLATVMTSVEFQISGRTHLCALAMCLLLYDWIPMSKLWVIMRNCSSRMWPCIFIPYCCCGGCCKRTVHTCPNCKAYIGTY